MFSITHDADGTIRIQGRFDASHVDAARAVFDKVESSCIVDFSELSYIASAGLGVLFAAQKRLVDSGESLTLANLSPHILEIFQIAGFVHIFEIK